MLRRLAAIAAIVGVFGLVGCTTLNPNSSNTNSDCPSGNCSDLVIGCFDVNGDPVSCNLKAPCDPGGDGVTDCVNPQECRVADNSVACDLNNGCLDRIGQDCAEWDPTCLCQVPPVAACGDGVLDAGEVCDDNNIVGGDGCSADCLSDESCGNGIVDALAGETCDDGNTVGGDGCSASCIDEACGNGTVDAGEACDDNNQTDGDGCSANCLSDESCGNSIVDSTVGEVCDDGNILGNDGCSSNCLSDETCGNGITDSLAGEMCDDNNQVDGDGCSADCLSDETCGNGILDATEVCDDNNNLSGDGCRSDCLSDETCGNGIIDSALGETCDAGAANSDVLADTCRTSCLLPSCGDGVLDTGEGCDDGNNVDGDGCTMNCIAEPDCGNGSLDGAEECDGGIGCNAFCECPDNNYQDGALLPGCLPCSVAGTCQAPASNFCASVPACWSSAFRVSAPVGATFWIKTGAGLEFPVVIPAGEYRDIGLLQKDQGAEGWCTSDDLSVSTIFPAGWPVFPPLVGVWAPGLAYGDNPNTPAWPADLTGQASFSTGNLVDLYIQVAQ